MFREGTFTPDHAKKPGTSKREGHIPRMLEWQDAFPASYDERGFEFHDQASGQPDHFKADIARWRDHGDKRLDRLKDRYLVTDLTRSLGRTPKPEEVARELSRQQLFDQILSEDLFPNNPTYVMTEVIPQQEVIARRREDFPNPENALEAFKKGKAHIENNGDVERLIIDVPNSEGKLVEHPVMTNEEIEWVRRSADTITRVMAKKPGSKIFIAGLGLGLLNKELATRGISLDRQVVAELNESVIALVGERLHDEFGGRLTVQQGTGEAVYQQHAEDSGTFEAVSVVNSTEQLVREASSNLDLRQGDFRNVLQVALEHGEQFEAISIDAFPNTADEVNRDASSKEVLELAMKALKPGGILTFYPDSRYIPERILNVLLHMNIPNTSEHYTVARFHTSEFTQQYHYGDLMAVVHIQKPLLAEADDATIDALVDEYFANLDRNIEEYAAGLTHGQSEAE